MELDTALTNSNKIIVQPSHVEIENFIQTV